MESMTFADLVREARKIGRRGNRDEIDSFSAKSHIHSQIMSGRIGADVPDEPESSDEWKAVSGLSQPSPEALQELTIKLLQENADLRRKLALAGDTRSFEYQGMKLIVSPDMPPIVWDGKELKILGAG